MCDLVMDQGQGISAPASTYHVFINHRGPDVKKSVASLIYYALKRFGLRVFLDEKELQAGYTLSPAIISAIRSSSVHIAIFSRRYAESEWCLNELLQMLQCDGQAKIIPVFYGVQPSDLREVERGPYAQAFHNHQRNDIHLLHRWKKALYAASQISGLVFNMDQGDLGEFVDRIVDNVLKQVRNEALEVAKHPVGLDKAARDLENEVFKQRRLSGIMVVGIAGLGGSGKSTLVKHLYNLKRAEFNRSCFLSEVSKKDLPSLQQKLLHDLLGYHDHLHIENSSEGNSLLRDRLRGLRRVLIVLDDLHDSERMEGLLLVKDVLGEGSLILVTSRYKDLLLCSEVSLVYNIKLLDKKEAQKLFCWHAFIHCNPVEGFEDLVEEFVAICAGFPLALKILGGQLFGKIDRNYWTRQLKNLHKQLPDDMLEKILRVSYNSLKSKEKEVFMDIAHFLVGEDKDLAVRVLEGLDCSGSDCLEALHQKCLVDFENAEVNFNEEIQHRKCPFTARPALGCLYLKEDFYIEEWRRPKGSSKIRMHDLVRDLAKQIAREEFLSIPVSKPLRICCPEDTCLQLQSRPCYIRGIRIDEDTRKLHAPVLLPDQVVCGLKFLVLEDSTVPLPYNGLVGDLVWLRLGKFTGNHIPSSLSLQSLRVLQVKGIHLERLSRTYDNEPPLQVSELTVDYREMSYETPISHQGTSSAISLLPDKNSPDFSSSFLLHRFQKWLGTLRNLVKIVLKNIKGLASLPVDFEELKNLIHLDLSGCSDLEGLPHSFTGLLQLQYLSLQDCSNLIILDLGKISTLEYINFEGCSLLKQLPRGTVAQRSLNYLNLVRTSLQELDEPLEQLKNLEQLLIGSPWLRSLPSSLNNLGRLTDLTLFECSSLYDINVSMERMTNLERLRICDAGVRALPEGIVWTNIKVLDVRCCLMDQIPFEQETLPLNSVHISCLTSLSIRGTFISKVYIPEAQTLFPSLEIVDLSNNAYLKQVEGLPGNLIRLNLMRCRTLTTLACLSNLIHLKFLDISGCQELETLNLQGLSSLEEIKADCCWKLRSIQGLGQLQKLSYLHSSTISEVISTEIYSILTFPSRISTAIVSGETFLEDVDEMNCTAMYLSPLSTCHIAPHSSGDRKSLFRAAKRFEFTGRTCSMLYSR